MCNLQLEATTNVKQLVELRVTPCLQHAGNASIERHRDCESPVARATTCKLPPLTNICMQSRNSADSEVYALSESGKLCHKTNFAPPPNSLDNISTTFDQYLHCNRTTPLKNRILVREVSMLNQRDPHHVEACSLACGRFLKSYYKRTVPYRYIIQAPCSFAASKADTHPQRRNPKPYSCFVCFERERLSSFPSRQPLPNTTPDLRLLHARSNGEINPCRRHTRTRMPYAHR